MAWVSVPCFTSETYCLSLVTIQSYGSYKLKIYFSASCAVVWPWHAFIIGAIGGLVTVVGTYLFDYLHVDDPVGAISVHGLSGIWVRMCSFCHNLLHQGCYGFLVQSYVCLEVIIPKVMIRSL